MPGDGNRHLLLMRMLVPVDWCLKAVASLDFSLYERSRRPV